MSVLATFYFNQGYSEFPVLTFSVYTCKQPDVHLYCLNQHDLPENLPSLIPTYLFTLSNLSHSTANLDD